MCLSIIIWLFGLAGVLVFFALLFDRPLAPARRHRNEHSRLGFFSFP